MDEQRFELPDGGSIVASDLRQAEREKQLEVMRQLERQILTLHFRMMNLPAGGKLFSFDQTVRRQKSASCG